MNNVAALTGLLLPLCGVRWMTVGIESLHAWWCAVERDQLGCVVSCDESCARLGVGMYVYIQVV